MEPRHEAGYFQPNKRRREPGDQDAAPKLLVTALTFFSFFLLFLFFSQVAFSLSSHRLTHKFCLLKKQKRREKNKKGKKTFCGRGSLVFDFQAPLFSVVLV